MSGTPIEPNPVASQNGTAMWASGPVVETWDEVPRVVAYMGLFCEPPTREKMLALVRHFRAMNEGVDESGWPLRDGPQ